MSDGWADSASAWIADMGDHGDYGREHVLDPPMMERVRARAPGRALDVGCGEGRFCRMMQACGISTVGIDPTAALLDQARSHDPGGDYRLGVAEDLLFEEDCFDLVVSYLSLIDIPDLPAAVAEMVRVLRPGGTLLIANLNGFTTAAMELGWQTGPDGEKRFSFDHYLDERAAWVGWRGIRIVNWHRPLSVYMSLLLGHGLVLRHFSEPAPTGGDPAKAARYRRAPWFLLMEWEKPLAG
jgi:SAM-dependent methyltransferase